MMLARNARAGVVVQAEAHPIPLQIARFHPVDVGVHRLNHHQCTGRIIANISPSPRFPAAGKERSRSNDRYVVRKPLLGVLAVARTEENRWPKGVESTIVRAVPGLIQLYLVEEALLLNERKDGDPPTQERLAVGIGDRCRRKEPVGRFVIAQGEFEACQIADALGSTGLLPGPTHGPDEPGEN